MLRVHSVSECSEREDPRIHLSSYWNDLKEQSLHA